MPVRATRLVRKMRGGAQAHLLEADDGCYYVVKFSNNPQHRRILVNELLASVFLRYLQITAPEAAIVQVDRHFLKHNPGAFIQLGTNRLPAEDGWHFGSRFPGDPDRVAVYDFLPDVLLPKVANLGDFLAIYVFDKWAGNADARQSVFFRASLKVAGEPGPLPGPETFVASMIDHGYVFNGPNWSFTDSPLHGLYHRPVVYEGVHGWKDFQPWLDRVQNFPEEILDQAFKHVPRQWLAPGEEGELERLLARLLTRRQRVAHLIEDSARNSRVNPFPNWQ